MAAPRRSVILTSVLLELTSLVARQRPRTVRKIAAMTSFPRSTVPSTRVRAERRLLSPGTQLPSPKHWYRVPDLTTTSGRGIGATGIAAADTAELHLQWQKRGAYSPHL